MGELGEGFTRTHGVLLGRAFGPLLKPLQTSQVFKRVNVRHLSSFYFLFCQGQTMCLKFEVYEEVRPALLDLLDPSLTVDQADLGHGARPLGPTRAETFIFNFSTACLFKFPI